MAQSLMMNGILPLVHPSHKLYVKKIEIVVGGMLIFSYLCNKYIAHHINNYGNEEFKGTSPLGICRFNVGYYAVFAAICCCGAQRG